MQFLGMLLIWHLAFENLVIRVILILSSTPFGCCQLTSRPLDQSWLLITWRVEGWVLRFNVTESTTMIQRPKMALLMGNKKGFLGTLSTQLLRFGLILAYVEKTTYGTQLTCELSAVLLVQKWPADCKWQKQVSVITVKWKKSNCDHFPLLSLDISLQKPDSAV